MYVEEVVEGVWCVFQSDVPEASHLAGSSSLLLRLPHLTRKMKNMSVQLVKKNPLPELSEDLDMFTGKEPCLSQSPVGVREEESEVLVRGRRRGRCWCERGGEGGVGVREEESEVLTVGAGCCFRGDHQ